MTAALADVIAKLIDSLKKLFTFLTWGRIAMMLVLLLLSGMTVAFWENRPVIYGVLTAGDKFSDVNIPVLSNTTKTSIKNIVDRHTNVIAVQIINTDWRTNTRDTIHFYSELTDLTAEFGMYEMNKIGPMQLFQAGDTEQNERLIKIIEQEFVCAPVPPNLIAMIPSAARFTQQICSISIPPKYGKMVGYANIWLAQPMTADSVPYYKGLARAISDEVYDRDVTKVKK